ncbi:MAG: serine hydrolase domain-containing protein [Mycobacteriales bacterium]
MTHSAQFLDAVRYLEHWVGYRQQTLRVPGLVAALACEGDVLLSHGYGLADVHAGTAMPTDAVFPIASHSKTFTTALVLLLVDQGALRLDDPVGKWLPDVEPPLRDVKLGDLLSHSAGITRDSRDADFWLQTRRFPTAEELLDTAEGVLPPHQQFKYSNIGFALAGRVIEAASSASYDDVAHAQLIDVLALTDTTTDTVGLRFPVGYSSRRGGAAREPIPVPGAAALAPATGWCSTARDLCAFASALCDDGLLRADTARVMRHVVWPGKNGDHDYCLGLMHTTVGERDVYGHGGSYPGFQTSTRFDAAAGLVAVVLTNAIDGPAQELTKSMLSIVDTALQCRPGQPAEGVAGRYVSSWSVVDVVSFGGTLLALDPELPDPVERRVELLDDGAGGWTIARGSGFGSPGEQVVFDQAGCRFGGMTMQRERAW